MPATPLDNIDFTNTVVADLDASQATVSPADPETKTIAALDVETLGRDRRRSVVWQIGWIILEVDAHYKPTPRLLKNNFYVKGHDLYVISADEYNLDVQEQLNLGRTFDANSPVPRGPCQR